MDAGCKRHGDSRPEASRQQATGDDEDGDRVAAVLVKMTVMMGVM